jgi:DNA polymerase-3 subunit chi
VTRIDFYILEDVARSALNRFACRLASQVVTGGHRVVIHTAGEEEARELDELLWHYPDRRFIPHTLEEADPAAPVVLTWNEPSVYDGVLFNLGATVPGFFTRFQRVVEIVVQETRDEGRDRYRFYRHRGYPLFDHQMDDWETDRRTGEMEAH